MKKLKHNHTLTDFLKFGIFAILLLMPILIFVPNAFYYGFNEHAVAQEKTEQVPVYYETNIVNNVDDIVIGNAYYFTDNFSYQNTSSGSYDIIRLYLTDNTLNNNIDLRYRVLLYISSNQDSLWMQYVRIDTGNYGYLFVGDKRFNFIADEKLAYANLLVGYLQNTNVIKEYQPLTTSMSITDSMSYAWDSVWQNDLFSWTSNNGIYTVINNMNTTLGIPSQARLADYLTYITLFTVVYIIIDIVIGTFTMLTHLFNKEPK